MKPLDRLTRFIADEFLDGSDIQTIPEDLNLVDAGIVDSLGLLRIVAFLEEEMGAVIEPEAMLPENLNSINAIMKLVAPDHSSVV